MSAVPEKYTAAIASVLKSAVAVSLKLQTPDWCEMLGVTLPDNFSEDEKAIHIGAMPARVKKSGEIARVYFNLKDRAFLLTPICDAVRVAVEPLSVGGYDFVVHNTSEGLEVIFADDRQIDRWLHATNSLT